MKSYQDNKTVSQPQKPKGATYKIKRKIYFLLVCMKRNRNKYA